MSAVKRHRPAHDSQRIDDDAWYYEAKGSIHVVVWTKVAGTSAKTVRSFRIRAQQLMETAKRCGWVLRPAKRPSRKAPRG